MSDKQTTAFVLLVILSMVFYLYHTQKLAPLVAIITGGNAGNIGKSWSTSTDASYITSQAQVANVSYDQWASGQNTAYTLNSFFNIGQNGNVQYSQPSGSSTSNDLSTITTLATLFG